jgi:dynein assembly factor 1
MSEIKYTLAEHPKLGEKKEEILSQHEMSRKAIDYILLNETKTKYYPVHELNESLYLHFKGFTKIDNLSTFKNLKALYLEGNKISKIENLDSLINLTSLFLHENTIQKIEGLDNLVNLTNLNLSDNLIKKIEGISKLINLTDFLIKRNRIGFEGLEDLKGLLETGKELRVLDISDNYIQDVNIIDEILSKIINLKVLYLSGNEVTRKIPNYRKTLIGKIKNLTYIDNKPIFNDEKRYALAFCKGGFEEERKEREKVKNEKKEKEQKKMEEFTKFYNEMYGIKNEDVKEEVKLSEDDKEKNKLEKLKKIQMKRNINNEIFAESEITYLPEIPKNNFTIPKNEIEVKEKSKDEDNKNEEKEIKENEKSEKNINDNFKEEKKEENNEKNNNDEDEIPSLEIVDKNINENNSNSFKVSIKETNLDDLD